MKRTLQIVLLIIACAAMVMASGPAQTTNLTTDVLGAHMVYGRGCVACHAPHSGPGGNGNYAASATSPGNVALWGQNLTPLYGLTLSFGDPTGGYSVTLPANAAAVTSAGAHDPTVVITLCLSCHDGNVAKPGMMKGTTVETLPVVGGNAPTFLGNDGSGTANYNNDHPVGPNATIGCGGQYNWDCTVSASGAITPGPLMTQFEANYGWTVSPAVIANVPTVTCTTCHDQHSNLIYSGTIGGTKGYYQTMFFIRGYYNPTTGSNSVAQFCRNCHGGESNEMHGQMNVPTI
jgi:cytochrome c553